jgi:hypothetical protein
MLYVMCQHMRGRHKWAVGEVADLAKVSGRSK